MADYLFPLGSPKFQAFDDNGNPLSGGKLYCFEANSSTPKDTWIDPIKETPNSNPVILDDRGEALIFGDGLYKFILKDSSDNLIWTMDYVLLLNVTDDARALLDDGSASAMRTTLGLGTVAISDTGTTENKIPVLGSSGLPAVGGSLLTGIALPRSYLAGLQFDYKDTGTLTILKGECRDSSHAKNIVLTSATFDKDLTGGTWTAGAGENGLQGSVANNEWYHVYALYKDSDGSFDIEFSATGPEAFSPTSASYSYFRRIGSIRTNATGEIIKFYQYGDEFLWDDPPLTVDVANLGDAEVLYPVNATDRYTPTEVSCEAIMNASVLAAGVSVVYLYCPDVPSESPVKEGASPIATIILDDVTIRFASGTIRIRTNTSGQIAARASAASTALDITTLGWVDRRGRDD